MREVSKRQAHPSLHGVAAGQVVEGRRRHHQFVRRQAVALELSGHDVVGPNRDLFVPGVPGQLDYLHAIQKGALR